MISRYIIIVMAAISSSVCMGLNYSIPYTDTPPTIDGYFTAGEWDNALHITMVFPDIVTPPKKGTIHPDTDAPNSPEDISVTWYLMWGEDALYIACHVLDDEHYWIADEGPFSQDGIQVLFNFLNNPDAIYHDDAAVYDFAPRTASSAEPAIFKRFGGVYALPNGQIGSTVWPEEAYFVEVKMPWSDFDTAYEPTVGDVHGVGLVVLDYDGPTIVSPGSTLMTDFGQGAYTASNPATWNTITLVEELECGDYGYLLADLNKDCIVNLLDLVILAKNWLVAH